jgi:ribosomal-protein-serine acetyltransferase
MFPCRIDGRTELHLLAESDAEEHCALIRENRDHLGAWIPRLREHESVADSLAFIRDARERFLRGAEVPLAVWCDDRLGGVVGLRGIDSVNRNASIGFYLGAIHQGRGLITAACRILLSYGFKELCLHRVEMSCAAENKKSRAIPMRLGMREEGTLRQALWLHDHFADLVVYGIVREEWFSRLVEEPSVN